MTCSQVENNSAVIFEIFNRKENLYEISSVVNIFKLDDHVLSHHSHIWLTSVLPVYEGCIVKLQACIDNFSTIW